MKLFDKDKQFACVSTIMIYDLFRDYEIYYIYKSLMLLFLWMHCGQKTAKWHKN